MLGSEFTPTCLQLDYERPHSWWEPWSLIGHLHCFVDLQRLRSTKGMSGRMEVVGTKTEPAPPPGPFSLPSFSELMKDLISGATSSVQ